MQVLPRSTGPGGHARVGGTPADTMHKGEGASFPKGLTSKAGQQRPIKVHDNDKLP